MQKAAPLVDEEYMRILHIGEVAFSYYQIQRSTFSERDYDEWLELLPDLLRSRYQALGYEDGKNSLDFRAYFAELRSREMVTYMREHLTPEDFSLWLEQRDTPASQH